jgi:hypothetical protein
MKSFLWEFLPKKNLSVWVVFRWEYLPTRTYKPVHSISELVLGSCTHCPPTLQHDSCLKAQG